MLTLRAVALVLSSLSFPLLGQDHPYPANVTEPPVTCAGCAGQNAAGQPNDGLPTMPHDVPLAGHTGRYVSSTSIPELQSGGLRTLRAGLVRVNPLHDRLYLQLGSAIGAYNLSTFFTQRLLEPVADVGGILPGNRVVWRSPLEKAARVDAFIYPETFDSGWSAPAAEGQERLHEFDVDDRGYVYYGSSVFGWGINIDDARTDGKQLPFRVQVNAPLAADMSLFTMKSGSTYYAYVSDSATTRLWDVTVTSPGLVATRSGAAHWVREWSKNDAAGHVALIQGDNVLRVYTYAALIAGTAPLAQHAATIGTLSDVSFDAAGNVWAAEQTQSGGILWKLAAGSYAKTTHELPPGAGYRPERLHVTGGYLALNATVPDGASRRHDLLLYDVTGGAPQPLDTGGFFREYYHAAPAGYAQPEGFTHTVEPFLYAKTDGTTYLFYSAYGLGDVYQLGNVLLPPRPRVTAVSPVSGLPSGGTEVTVGGRHFAQDAVVSFDGLPAPTTFVSGNRLTAVTPAHEPGVVTLSVSSGGQTLPGGKFTYLVATPTGFFATAQGPAVVGLRWNPSPNAHWYEIFRDHVSIGMTDDTTSYPTAAPDTAHVYSVRALDRWGNPSPKTPGDLAIAGELVDSAFVAGMRVRAGHLADLRRFVNAARTLAGLPAATWTGSATIRAVHVEELRTALNAALTALGLGTVPGTDPSLAGLHIKAVHMQELLAAMR